MKKILIAATMFIALGAKAHAAFEYTIADKVTLVMPLSNFSGVALYDFNGKESLLGGETTIVKFPKLQTLELTVGGVGDLSNEAQSELNHEGDDRQLLRGTPFVGAKYNIEALAIKDILNVGIFYGRHLQEGRNIYGVKFDKKFWGK
jgi:hypothetical protein